jgi:hypothetical protein
MEDPLYVLHKLWQWDKDLLTPEEIYNKFFLAKDGMVGTA